MSTKFLNARYILMQVCYWGIVCALTGYAAVYLAGKGFTAGQTGSLTAIGSVGAFILQPIAAVQADKEGKFSLKELLISIGVVNILFILSLCVMGSNYWIVAVLFCAAGVTTQILRQCAWHLRDSDPADVFFCHLYSCFRILRKSGDG
mgnify:CR=1 FL=1